jgi:hypothetical protein
MGDAQYLLRAIRKRETDFMESLLRGDSASIPKLAREPAASG